MALSIPSIFCVLLADSCLFCDVLSLAFKDISLPEFLDAFSDLVRFIWCLILRQLDHISVISIMGKNVHTEQLCTAPKIEDVLHGLHYVASRWLYIFLIKLALSVVEKLIYVVFLFKQYNRYLLASSFPKRSRHCSVTSKTSLNCYCLWSTVWLVIPLELENEFQTSCAGYFVGAYIMASAKKVFLWLFHILLFPTCRVYKTFRPVWWIKFLNKIATYLFPNLN